MNPSVPENDHARLGAATFKVKGYKNAPVTPAHGSGRDSSTRNPMGCREGMFCGKCKRDIKTEADYRNHLVRVHGDDIVLCDYCAEKIRRDEVPKHNRRRH